MDVDVLFSWNLYLIIIGIGLQNMTSFDVFPYCVNPQKIGELAIATSYHCLLDILSGDDKGGEGISNGDVSTFFCGKDLWDLSVM